MAGRSVVRQYRLLLLHVRPYFRRECWDFTDCFCSGTTRDGRTYEFKTDQSKGWHDRLRLFLNSNWYTYLDGVSAAASAFSPAMQCRTLHTLSDALMQCALSHSSCAPSLLLSLTHTRTHARTRTPHAHHTLPSQKPFSASPTQSVPSSATCSSADGHPFEHPQRSTNLICFRAGGYPKKRWFQVLGTGSDGHVH